MSTAPAYLTSSVALTPDLDALAAEIKRARNMRDGAARAGPVAVVYASDRLSEQGKQEDRESIESSLRAAAPADWRAFVWQEHNDGVDQALSDTLVAFVGMEGPR